MCSLVLMKTSCLVKATVQKIFSLKASIQCTQSHFFWRIYSKQKPPCLTCSVLSCFSFPPSFSSSSSSSPPSPGPSPYGSDGRGTSDGSSADDVQPACSQTHQPLRTHARSPGDALHTSDRASSALLESIRTFTLGILLWNSCCKILFWNPGKMMFVEMIQTSSLSVFSDAVHVIQSGG